MQLIGLRKVILIINANVLYMKMYRQMETKFNNLNKSDMKNEITKLAETKAINYEPLLYADVKVGMVVIDADGDDGIITEIEDSHNVWVNYGCNGSGVFCMDKDCKDFDQLYICI